MTKRNVVGKIFGIALVFAVIGSMLGGLSPVAPSFAGFGNQNQALAQDPKTWYVDDDLADYPSADFTKIQDAVNAASSGDTIFVYGGTYYEHINTSKDTLTLIAQDKDDTIIDGGYSEDAVVRVNADFINIIGFTIKSHKESVWESHGGILLSHSNNCEIKNNNCLNNCIWLEESSNNVISDNTASFDFVGIGLFSSNNNTVDSNNVSHHGDYGILLESSSCNNTIIGNSATDSCWGIGVRMYNTNNKIIGNTATDNSYGIALWSSSVSNYVARNNISNNWFGLCSSSYNNIYLNNFLGNTNDNIDSDGSLTIWHSPEEITYTYNSKTYTNYLGNYWSDYTGSDADGDGIGDTPYSIDSDKDNYPLVEPFENYGTGQSGTEVGGTISSDTTWPAANSPYVVTSNIVVNPGVTLTIEPGVTLRFELGKAIQVDGQLIARGTEAEPIVFTSNQISPAPGDWVYISFTDSSVDATYDEAGNYVSGSILQYCIVQYGGGGDMAAIVMLSSSPLIDRCDINNNAGGGIFVDGGSPKIIANVISANSRTWGGGIHVRTGVVSIIGNLISNNSATWGGGIDIGWATATISGNTITGNFAEQDGGGISAVGTVTIDDNVIENNSASHNGGGIDARYGPVTISNNTLDRNSAGCGGGIYAIGGTFNISNNIVRNNLADAGGGIYAYEGVITGNSIRGNSANNGGGIMATGPVTIRGNTISSNSASLEGGGIFCSPGSQQTVLMEYNNIINNNGNGITILGQLTTVSPSTVHSNNIYSNKPYSMVDNSKVDIPDVDATGNWWGTTDEATIQEYIYDWNDDASLGRIIYQPIATAPIPEAPPVQYDLTVASTAGGSVITPGEGTFTYNASEVVSLVATADANYTFVYWTGDTGTIANTTAANTTITMDDDYSITAEFTPGWVPYVPTSEQVTIAPVTSEAMTSVEVTLEFPSIGYRVEDWGSVQRVGNEFSVDAKIERWTGAVIMIVPLPYEYKYELGELSGGNYKFTFKAWGHPVESKQFTLCDLTISSTAGGSVTTPGEGTFTYNASEVVDLVATADSGYQFMNWSGDTGTVDDVDAASTNITMNGNYSITANFAEGALAPVWSVGDNWVYDCSYENPGGNTEEDTNELNVTVVGEEVVGDEACYKCSGIFEPAATRDAADMPLTLHIGDAEIWNSKAHMEYLNQSLAIAELPGLPMTITWSYAGDYGWPYEVGETWSFTKHTVAGPLDETVDREAKVLGVEAVTVPAGTFECYHIVTYDPASPDNYTFEHWFNPTVVKSDVKMIDRDTWAGAETRVLSWFEMRPAAEVNISPESQEVSCAEPFTIEVVVSPNPEVAIAGIQFDLSFNPSLIAVDSVEEGSFLSQNGASTYFSPGTIDNDAGTITGVAGAITTPGETVSSLGTFAIINFTAKEIEEEGTSSLNLSNVIVGDKDGNPVPISVSSGNVTVIPYPDWDVNCDDHVNVLDMIGIGQHWGESGEPHWIREDVNRDGNINVLDMILIGQHWTG